MTNSNSCIECGVPYEGYGPRCKACEAGNPSADQGLLATVDHSPSAIRSAPARGGFLDPGATFGEYRVIRQLGKGGMGSVYEAEETESGRRVALKLFGQSLDSTDARQRFLREGRLAASISHPNTVYVYGTEEINGIPAISMELVAGGTLEAKVRESGPMPVGKAVDTILQIIDGLEAAQKIGVLHRDIKASNCFIDASGAVKVGDFGLSVSTVTKTDLKLTSSGSFLGTPSYASPEQLRGQSLDVRSDIYSVGVTLFYLLTGKIPFEADSFVQLIAAVLEQPTPSAAQFRKEVPRDLAAVVSKCLDKQPAKRFQSYEELKTALEPFTSAAPVAAGIPLRLLAGIIDSVILFLASMLQLAISSLFGINMLEPGFLGSAMHLKIYAVSIGWTLAYYVISEAFFGATPGKALCGLRVIGANRGKPSFLAALIRASIYYTVPCLPTWIFLGFQPPVTGADSLDFFALAMAFAIYPALGSLFVTCRKRNGYAAVHDLASASRVILKPEKEWRPKAEFGQTLESADGSPPKVGPYRILRRLDRHWLLAHDDKLARDVWIRLCAPQAAPFPSTAGNVARPGRLRWLGGKRDANEGWDAFEAAPGAALCTMFNKPHRWDTVRFWLADLAQELAASEASGTLPETLSLDRVWITSDHRAKLLDLPAPGAPDSERAITPTPGAPFDDRPRLLLRSVAAWALSGREVDAQSASLIPATETLPLHARQILDGLVQLPPPQATAEALSGVLKKRAHVTRLRRLTLVLACLAFPLFSATVPYAVTLFIRQWDKAMPSVMQIHERMELITENPFIKSSKKPVTGEDREAVEKVIATRYASEIQNPQFWNSLYAQNVIVPWERTAAMKIIKERKPVSPKELAESEVKVNEILKKRGNSRPLEKLHPLLALISFLVVSTLFYAAIPAWLTAIAFRGGLFLAMLGLVVVDQQGRPVSRWRMLWRSIIAWGTIPLYVWLAMSLLPVFGQAIAASIALSLFLGLYLLSPLLPGRGIPDRLAGTYLVMK